MTNLQRSGDSSLAFRFAAEADIPSPLKPINVGGR
jgi:hypothetical protein